MTSDELQVLSARLNKLMDQARDLPDLSYEALSI